MKAVALLLAIVVPVLATTHSKTRDGKRTTANARKHEKKATRIAVSPAVRQAEIQRVTQRLEASEAHFENAAALVPFFELLNQAQDNKTAIHILQFGDSHTASDDWVNSMRSSLQARYGNGGPGFTLAGHPFRGYRRFDVKGSASAGW